MKSFPVMIITRFFMAFAVLAVMTACAAPGLRISGMEGVLQPEKIVEVGSGIILTADALVSRLASARVVFLGEYHTHALQHRRQLEIIQNLYAMDGNLAVGLEVFAREQQGLLDDWTTGRIAEEEFRGRVEGDILNSSVFEVYYPLLLWARENRVRLLGLNAPREVTALVARKGLAGLDPDQRARVAGDIVIGPEAYRRRVTEAFHGHAMGGNMDNFFAAQVVWDETMAETLAGYLNSAEGLSGRIVVICGNEHIMYGFGVPGRLARRLDVSQQSVIMLLGLEDEQLTDSAADYVWVTAPEPPRRRMRLGVTLESGPQGELLVTGITPGSEAERIGLRPGDRLVGMDGVDLTSFMDLHRAAVDGGAEREHALVVERLGRIIEFSFRFREE